MDPLLPGTFNSRDIGGIRAGAGLVRSGQVVRSDAPVRLGDAGRLALRALAISRAIDLREPMERELDPADLDGVDIEIHHRPILSDGFAVASHSTLEEMYREVLAWRGVRIAAVLRLLAQDDTPTLIFCSAGKDRTGIVMAVLLSALGVADEDIVADYACTERNLDGAFRTAIEARAAASGLTKQELAAKLGAPPRLMRDTLAWLRRTYGGTPEYVNVNGVSYSELSTLRQRLVRPLRADARQPS
jgi:protein-tyrosine phosphatase